MLDSTLTQTRKSSIRGRVGYCGVHLHWCHPISTPFVSAVCLRVSTDRFLTVVVSFSPLARVNSPFTWIVEKEMQATRAEFINDGTVVKIQIEDEYKETKLLSVAAAGNLVR